MAASQRGSDGERLVAVETTLGLVKERVDQLGDRSHEQATAITVVSGNVDHLVSAIDRVERRQEENRIAVGKEHVELKAEIKRDSVAKHAENKAAIAESKLSIAVVDGKIEALEIKVDRRIDELHGRFTGGMWKVIGALSTVIIAAVTALGWIIVKGPPWPHH